MSEDYIPLYLGMALYLDNIARQIRDFIYNEFDEGREIEIDIHIYDHDDPVCKWQLEQELKIAGIGMAWEVFLDCMSGGTTTLMQNYH